LPTGLSGPVYNNYVVDVLQYILAKTVAACWNCSTKTLIVSRNVAPPTSKSVLRSSQAPTKLILGALFFVSGYYS